MAASDTSTTTETARARPTKHLIVDVLTKDIDLIAAIVDLVDNSVDAARRLTRDAATLKGFKVEISFDDETFAIADNCGGISLGDARARAFRFGPDPETDPPDDYSTGQFGIGMKRALFKLGDGFTIKSRAATDQFDLEVDVRKWLVEPEWDFPLKRIKRSQKRPEGKRGTTISVAPLKPTIARQLGRTTPRTQRPQNADRSTPPAQHRSRTRDQGQRTKAHGQSP